MKKDTFYTVNEWNKNALDTQLSTVDDTVGNGEYLPPTVISDEEVSKPAPKNSTLFTVNEFNKDAVNKKRMYWPGGPLGVAQKYTTNAYNTINGNNNSDPLLKSMNITPSNSTSSPVWGSGYKWSGYYGNSTYPYSGPVQRPQSAVSSLGVNSINSGYNPSKAVDEASKNMGAGLSAMKQPTTSGDTGGGGAQGSGGAGWAAAGTAVSALGSINTGERRGMFDTLDPVHHLAGGRESGVGNALGDAGTGVFQAGLSTGNPYLMIGGAALKVVGGLTNAAFGTKVDEVKKKAIEEGIAKSNNFISNATDFDDVVGPEGMMTDTDVYEGGWFSKSSARRKNEELRRKLENARSWASRSVLGNVYNIRRDQMNNALANYSALGGRITTFPLDKGL